jgi:hypothetical protein
MNDMTKVIVPKSDQLNADDLLSGPITIKITAVTIKGGNEQPISINFEGDNGKPYKPCKSMCRVMVLSWGADSSKYVGRSMTLYNDPKVKWAGLEVGGLRISHMSDISETMTMALTVTRGNKKPYIVKPLSTLQKSTNAANITKAFQGTIVPNGETKEPLVITEDDRQPYIRALIDIRSRFPKNLKESSNQLIDFTIMKEDVTLAELKDLLEKANNSLTKQGVLK